MKSELRQVTEGLGDVQESQKRIMHSVLFCKHFCSYRLGREMKEQDQENQAIISWLSALNFGTKQQDYLSRRQEGTGEWLSNEGRFKEWLSGSKRILWGHGIRTFPRPAFF